MIAWLKSLFESEAKRKLRASRKDLHENRHEMQRSVSAAMNVRRQSSKALEVAERALRSLEKNRNEQK